MSVCYIYTHCYFVVKKQFFCGINGRIMFSIRLDDSRARKMHTNGKKPRERMEVNDRDERTDMNEKNNNDNEIT